MNDRRRVKLLREGDYVAEVEVDRIDAPTGWGPYLSVDDARMLDRVRAALKAGDTDEAARHGRVYRLLPVSAA